MRILLYGNGSSGNHGCEAIVRGTVALLGESQEYLIQSANRAEDQRYGLEELALIKEARSGRPKDIRFLKAYLKLKTTGNYVDMDGLYYLLGIESVRDKVDVALSIGGDNYCYGGTGLYAYLNRAYRKNKMKTVLWGCSIEPEVVEQPEVAEDLASYDLVVARESITYEAMKPIQKNLIMVPDSAFWMEPVPCYVDERLERNVVIGINISPMIISNEKTSGMAYENYKHLITYILATTDAVVALIPHVVWASNDDRAVLRRLYEDFDQNPRLVLVEDHTAPELKYIISHCKMFVGARTHATIAAYSCCVPTLVVGYSVKARGIARDLFGTEEGYVLPVQELTRPSQLTEVFQVLYEKQDNIREHLKDTLPSYMMSGHAAVEAIKGLETQ